MVFVKDFREDFYKPIQHQRVLILVALDVDALCACKILQYLFQCDQVLYTIVAVTGQNELERAFVEHSEGVQHVIMINCGAAIDIIEAFQPEDNVIFYICDSHRPVEVHNIFNQVQVKLLMREDDFENVPDFHDVFQEDESDEESDNMSDDSTGKRQRFDEASLEKRAKKRKWEENRRRILFAYAEFSSYGMSASFLLYEMAWKMSKDTNDLLWLAIIGVSEQYLNCKVERDRYIEYVGHLQTHVSRLNHRSDCDDNTTSVDCLKLAFDQELRLPLYKHWSLMESLCHAQYVACHFKVWTMKGRKKLHEFLADMGMPLVQCQQKFVSMDVSCKENVKDLLGKYTEKYSISDQELFLPSFQAQYGYRHKYSAIDVVSACDAQLESTDKDTSPSDNFLAAADLLRRGNSDLMERCLEMAKTQLKAQVTQVNTFLDMNQVISAGPFLYAFIQEGTPDGRLFAHPQCLSRLARFTLEAYCATTKSKRAKSLPFVLGAHHESEIGTMLVVGLPPLLDKSLKNCFGKAFEQAASTTNSRILNDYFDTNVIELKSEDRSKFFDALITLLQ